MSTAAHKMIRICMRERKFGPFLLQVHVTVSIVAYEIPRNCDGWKHWGHTVSGLYTIDPDLFEPLPEFQVSLLMTMFTI